MIQVFSDVLSLVQSAQDGYNGFMFGYGKTHSHKSHAVEGSRYDRGLHTCFEELFNVAKLDATPASQYKIWC